MHILSAVTCTDEAAPGCRRCMSKVPVAIAARVEHHGAPSSLVATAVLMAHCQSKGYTSVLLTHIHLSAGTGGASMPRTHTPSMDAQWRVSQGVGHLACLISESALLIERYLHQEQPHGVAPSGSTSGLFEAVDLLYSGIAEARALLPHVTDYSISASEGSAGPTVGDTPQQPGPAQHGAPPLAHFCKLGSRDLPAIPLPGQGGRRMILQDLEGDLRCTDVPLDVWVLHPHFAHSRANPHRYMKRSGHDAMRLARRSWERLGTFTLGRNLASCLRLAKAWNRRRYTSYLPTYVSRPAAQGTYRRLEVNLCQTVEAVEGDWGASHTC